jgi:hypothetical protein
MDLDAIYACSRPCISAVIRACRTMIYQYEAQGADKTISSAIDRHVPGRQVCWSLLANSPDGS